MTQQTGDSVHPDDTLYVWGGAQGFGKAAAKLAAVVLGLTCVIVGGVLWMAR